MEEKRENYPIGFLLHEVQKTFIDYVRSEVSKLGINPTYHFVLMCLKDKKDGLTQSQICEKIRLKKSSVSLLLQQMESDGLIERKQSETDKRVIYVSLTDKGMKLDLEIKEIFDEAESKMQDSMTDEEAKLLKKLLNKIVLNMQSVNKEVPQND